MQSLPLKTGREVFVTFQTHRTTERGCQGPLEVIWFKPLLQQGHPELLARDHVLEISEISASPFGRVALGQDCSFYQNGITSEYYPFIFTFPSVLRCLIAIVYTETPSDPISVSSPEINQTMTLCPVKSSLPVHGSSVDVFAKEILTLRTKCIFTSESQAALSHSIILTHTSASIMKLPFAVSYCMPMLATYFYCDAGCSN